MATNTYNPQERVAEMTKAIEFKANHVSQSIQEIANQTYNQEYGKYFEQEKAKVIQQNQNNMEKIISQKNIERSSVINECRLKKMTRRYELLQTLKLEVRKSLEIQIQNKEVYKKLLKNLIIQSMIKLMEENIELQCKKEDLYLIESLLYECEQDFNSLVIKECKKKSFNSKIKVNRDHFLDDKFKNLLGGIVISCYDGKIVCSNTLDARIEQSFQEFLPQIRNGLYPDFNNEGEIIKNKN
ncbi:vacuolar ATP synthase subunit e, putative [Ichthyophthirius multifiliis]|uniref:Vacuolar ATP synthase subunit e, putative n=1 Tax=Ichthyophthirius multifiliis TaxID=5932 RepID=G0R1Q3_ICHMU|nr:vacuolar ATP synthase subunit e, putative [Ichthyophthirius multifiliis]EGR28598.1 vacuolar ATP synthase subunit e, putative [Ichthyophthirius multifiliis]|eukprot:XP_004029834.1 vacuolar ATP synthase subunit e, putative [Ichthyophthirius multifiliis]